MKAVIQAGVFAKGIIRETSSRLKFMIEPNMIHATFRLSVKKLLFLDSIFIYPKLTSLMQSVDEFVKLYKKYFRSIHSHDS